MAITVQAVTREFNYSGLALPDPGAEFTPEEVRDMYSAQYPELASATVSVPEYVGAVAQYKFERSAGAKGAVPHA